MASSQPKTTRCPSKTKDWHAFVDLMPPGPKSLHVVGSVLAPTPGYRVTLKPAVPPGINPAELILVVGLEPLPGGWPDVLTWLHARYDDAHYQGAYQEVVIQCGGKVLAKTKIEEVH